MTDTRADMPPDGLTELIKDTLIEYGAGPQTSIHSWRCAHPDRYGDCDCVDELAADLALRIRRRRFDLPVLRQAREEGWL